MVNYVTINSKTQPPYLPRTPGQGGTDLSLTGYDSWRSFGTACYMLGLRGGTTRAGIGAMYGTVMGREGGGKMWENSGVYHRRDKRQTK